MKLKQNVSVKGILQAFKYINGKDVPITAPFKNLILDAFIDSVHSGNFSAYRVDAAGSSTIGASIRVGSGTTPPSPSDTALVTPLRLGNNMSVVSWNVEIIDNNYVQTRTVRVEFSAATIAQNFTEIAVYTANNGVPTANYPIISRSLIKDILGEPSSISVDVDEILVIYYTFICTSPREVVYNGVIKGVPTEIRAINHWSTTEAYQMNQFPFLAGTNSILSGAPAKYVRHTLIDFTLPTPSDTLTINNWSNSTATDITTRTPLSVETGLKSRCRYGLSLINGSTVYGMYIPHSSVWTGFNKGWYLKFTPAFSKANTEVIDFETITIVSRA
ncbi:MAG: hypothetical protein CMC55_06785 [Flavobacteriaceae bacterium]|nr:hypothetical protein [Flavobacteriaceae bacterium]